MSDWIILAATTAVVIVTLAMPARAACVLTPGYSACAPPARPCPITVEEAQREKEWAVAVYSAMAQTVLDQRRLVTREQYDRAFKALEDAFACLKIAKEQR
jgi:hypothetical protein